MANIIYARVMQKTATLDEWMSSDLVLLDGEQAFVVSSDGSPINFKIGDGTKTFSELPFWIQYDQAQYISIDSNTLPTPTQDVGYSIVGSGTYTRAGQSDVLVPSGHMGILNWDGSVWYLGSSVELPEQAADGEIEEGDDRAVSGDTVFKYALRKNTDRILPEDRGFIPFDRPDIDIDRYERHVIHMDESGFTFIYPNPEDIVTKESGQSLPEDVSYIDLDRPDLVIPYVVVLDSNNLYVPIARDRDIGRTVTYKDFGEMEGYEVESVKDLEEYYQIWEDARGGNSSYITRTALRSSGKGNLPIWRYDFKPKNAQIKIFMIGLSHGWEKNTSFGWARFMRQLANDWQGNEALTFIRQNVHIIAIPCVSPDNFVDSLFNGSPTVRMRNNYETDFIDANFTASGTDINVTFTASDFPASEFFSYSDYFVERKEGIEGKIGVTLIDSSNTDAVKHNEVYRLKEVVGAGNIILTNDKSVSGVQSGTLSFAVLVDPERNYGVIGWDDYISGNPYGEPRTYYDNKGTKPFSLKETNNIKDIISSNPDISSFINWHSGAGDYLTYFSNSSYNNEDTTLVNLKHMFEGLFDVDVTNTANTNPTTINYISQVMPILASTPEWHSSEPSGTGNMTKNQATELHRWIGNYIYMNSLINSYNK